MATLLGVITCAGGAAAADYYVSPAGSDAASGSFASPWRTVGKAASSVTAGDTVFVRGGVYAERVTLSRSGTSSSRIVFRNYAGETPVLDGSGLPVGEETAMLHIDGQDHVTFEGFEIRDLVTGTNTHTPIGILVEGIAVGIEIGSCRIHGIENNGDAGNAHGILVAGTGSTPISQLVIRDCELHDLVLGTSEALAVNGNVDGFEIRGNTVRDCNNIGIDFIGFEGTGPTPGVDQARNGICAENVVHGCSTISNPAYGSWSCAGIYVDGGRDIVIERNRVYLNDIGIEIASEHAGRATENVTVRDNLIWRNGYGGVFTGGYNSLVGSTVNCELAGNTLYQNDSAQDGNGELYIRYKTYGLTLCNNILVANDQRLLVSRITTDTTGLEFDYNLFSAPGESLWSWGDIEWFSGFGNWKSTSGQDANSTFASPGFANTSGAIGSFDFRITDASPAHETGDSAFVAASGQMDAYGNPRVTGLRVDIGAHELSSGGLTPSEEWRLLHFGTTSDTGDAADLANPDRDGLVNLLEFAFGSDPNAADGGGYPEVLSAGSIAFDRHPEASGELRYGFYSSEDISPGSWDLIAERVAGGAWNPVSGVSVSDDGTRAVLSDTRPSGGRRFYRVGVSR